MKDDEDDEDDGKGTLYRKPLKLMMENLSLLNLKLNTINNCALVSRSSQKAKFGSKADVCG